MFIISGGKGTGKTHALIGKVKAENGILVCEDVAAMRARAYSYGVTGLDIMSYEELKERNMDNAGRPVYIHDINKFLNHNFSDVSGYSVCCE